MPCARLPITTRSSMQLRARRRSVRTHVLATSAALSATATLAHAQNPIDKLVVHGYFTQAYAKSDRLPVAGITKDGTTNYRVVALQARYLLTDEDQLVVQIRDAKSGNSLLNSDGVQLQWAYYQHRFDKLTAVVGRAPLPQGLYNNVREVGTILPFYRAPLNYYLPGYETIDGVLVSNTTPFGAWRLESTAYYGAITYSAPVFDPSGTFLVNDRTEHNYGAQLWLETPIPGLRVGSQFLSFQYVTGADTLRSNLVAGALDGTFEHGFVRGEYERYGLGQLGPGGSYEVETDAYLEGGVKLTKQFSVNAQNAVTVIHYPGRNYRNVYDRVLGVSYAPSTQLVFKLEGHHTTGYVFDQPMDITQPPGKTNYGIASVSTSF